MRTHSAWESSNHSTAAATWRPEIWPFDQLSAGLRAAGGVQAAHREAAAQMGLGRRRADQLLVAAEGREDPLGPGEVGRVVVARASPAWGAWIVASQAAAALELLDLAVAGQVAGHHHQVEFAVVDAAGRGGRPRRRSRRRSGCRRGAPGGSVTPSMSLRDRQDAGEPRSVAHLRQVLQLHGLAVEQRRDAVRGPDAGRPGSGETSTPGVSRQSPVTACRPSRMRSPAPCTSKAAASSAALVVVHRPRGQRAHEDQRLGLLPRAAVEDVAQPAAGRCGAWRAARAARRAWACRTAPPRGPAPRGRASRRWRRPGSCGPRPRRRRSAVRSPARARASAPPARGGRHRSAWGSMFMVPPGRGAIIGPSGPQSSAAARAVPSPASTISRSGCGVHRGAQAFGDVVRFGRPDIGGQPAVGEDRLDLGGRGLADAARGDIGHHLDGLELSSPPIACALARKSRWPWPSQPAPASRKDWPAWLAASRTCGSALLTAAFRFWSATLPPPPKEPLTAASASSATPQTAATKVRVMNTGWRRRLARSSLRPRS